MATLLLVTQQKTLSVSWHSYMAIMHKYMKCSYTAVSCLSVIKLWACWFHDINSARQTSVQLAHSLCSERQSVQVL